MILNTYSGFLYVVNLYSWIGNILLLHAHVEILIASVSNRCNITRLGIVHSGKDLRPRRKHVISKLLCWDTPPLSPAGTFSRNFGIISADWA